MIVVIADDITGAAEMGGIALRYGLKSMVANDVISDAKADVLIIGNEIDCHPLTGSYAEMIFVNFADAR